MLNNAVCFTLDWDRGGALFLPTFHLVSSTIRLNGGISAGSLGRSLLNISANSVQRVRNRDSRSSSPERCIRKRMTVSEYDVDHGLKVSVLSWSILSLSALESCSDSRTTDASVRDIWVTVGSFNGDVKGWPFGVLLEGSKSSLGWQPQPLYGSEVLSSVISTALMSSNWLGIWRTSPYFLIVERPMIRSKGEESKMIA